MIVIIGNGIAGVTTARHIRERSSEPVTLISSESKYFFSRTALMYVFMGHMKFEHTQPFEPHFWEEKDIRLVFDHVESVDPDTRSLQLQSGETMNYDKLVIASGSRPRSIGWPGEKADGVRGLYSKQDLEYLEARADRIQSAVIVGGGLIGIELAEMLLSRNIEVHFLVRESHFFGNILPKHTAQFLMDHFKRHHGLHMYYEEELAEIIPDDHGHVKGIRTKSGNEIACEYVGLTIGVEPNISFLEGSGIETNRGVLVDKFLQTSARDVYAIGDCAEVRQPSSGRRALEPVWYTGRFMGETLARTLTGEATSYNPGHWFNSAKFFDIEYQTYGLVGNELRDNEAEFVFRHPDKEILLHFVFDAETRRFIGVNTFGTRLRQMVFNHWLINNATIEEVIRQLGMANFDPEFYASYERDLIQAFNTQFNTQIPPGKKGWWQQITAR